jgi:hypothetical protein
LPYPKVSNHSHSLIKALVVVTLHWHLIVHAGRFLRWVTRVYTPRHFSVHPGHTMDGSLCRSLCQLVQDFGLSQCLWCPALSPVTLSRSGKVYQSYTCNVRPYPRRVCGFASGEMMYRVCGLRGHLLPPVICPVCARCVVLPLIDWLVTITSGDPGYS